MREGLMIRIKTEQGELTGRTIQSAARTAYGRTATILPASPGATDHVARIFVPRFGVVGTVYRVEGEPVAPLTHEEALAVADLIGDCMNWNGFVREDRRARLFAAIDNPTQATWDNAYSLILTDIAVGLGQATLWENVLGVSSYGIRSKAVDGLWPSIPLRSELMDALRRAVRLNREALASA
jgi:hypothetical protein